MFTMHHGQYIHMPELAKPVEAFFWSFAFDYPVVYIRIVGFIRQFKQEVFDILLKLICIFYLIINMCQQQLGD